LDRIFVVFLSALPALLGGSWSATGSMATPRQRHTATLLQDGRVLVTGGMVGVESSTATASAEIYDPVTGTWSLTGNMMKARSRHTATLLPNGKVLIAGGRGTNTLSRSSAELYDPATGVFTLTGAMADARDNFSANLLADGRVLVSGGVSRGK